MSALNSLFNRGLLGARCKTCLNLAISRIKLLRNKREVQLKQMRKEIAQFLLTGQESIARIRVEHVIREQNILAAYEVLELFCEFVHARVPILETQRECPTELQEPIASIIFAAPRCSDLPELIQIRNLFSSKYGKQFVAAASELHPGTSVNRTIIEKLAVRAPSADAKLRTMKEIAREHNIEWDSSSTEVEFRKTHEDLLEGSSQVFSKTLNSQTPISPSTIAKTAVHANKNGEAQPAQAISVDGSARFGANKPLTNIDKIERPMNTQIEESISDKKVETSWRSSEVLERAQAAIASADRACASARAAAELVKVRVALRSGNLQ
ncbi:hypothetical protein QJS10_CPA01g01460 [Acorus calamus]|uniref:IST1-like protein n=1 Tax=Acorus calamus TaxID=4465 RepID=A0AAV9FEY9_ACOCL|nr:hypothetical protein QJS10_CPA01g01460 [Acorus calamus]